ncbi:hypothetical protein BKA62DRAFT_819504, partial [Auriculariales sp. MPI-PUGE-AT-0066]
LQRDCPPWPSHPHNETLDEVYSLAIARNVTPKVLLATFETAWVESRVWPLDCGDQDSVGVFQQRPSQGWGSVEQCMNTTYAAGKFLDGAKRNDALHPEYTAGQLAQSVQISDFPDRYDEAEDRALDLITQARQQAQDVLVQAVSALQKLKSLSASTSISSAGIQVAVSLNDTHSSTELIAFGTIVRGCDLYARGSTCGLYWTFYRYGLQQKYDATLAQLQFWNPILDAGCTTMEAALFYCVKSSMVPPPSDIAEKTITRDCAKYARAKKSTTCDKITSKHGINLETLRVWNTGINSDCSNLATGTSYCVSAI